MSRRASDALIGLVYLIIIAALVLLSIAIFDKTFSDYTEVSARTGSVGNSLQPGSDVKVRGVLVGQVGDVTTDGDGAKVQLLLDPSKAAQLPSNVTVQLLPKTLFGESFVNLALPSRPIGELRDGDSIRQDTSPHTVALEKLFADLLPLLQAVQPQKLSATLGEVAGALRGRGADLGRTLTVVGRYLDGLAPDVPQLADDLNRLASVASTYTSAAPDIIDGLQSLTTTSRTLVAQRSQYQQLLSSLTKTGDTFGDFVGTNEDQIIGLSADSRPGLRILARYSHEFPCLTRALKAFIPRVNKAFGAGTSTPGARVVLRVVRRSAAYRTSDKPKTYTADPGPRCPYVPANGLASTALADVPGITGADTTADRVDPTIAGMGSANSPAENRLIAELVAPTTGTSPAGYPAWASLVLGPALRGRQVTLK